jgi:enamine deaminase RidA (YjgF/YER057c/UK114 family)
MRRWILRTVAFATVLMTLSAAAWAGRNGSGHKKKSEQEPKPQVLPLPKEPPRALAADVNRITFRALPLLHTGHLSAQIKESMTQLLKQTRGDTIVKLRAFVAGAGDSRRVQDVVGEMFSEKKDALPVLTIVQVGALGDDAAAVAFEAVVEEKRISNPNGLAFFTGQNGATLQEAEERLQARVTKSALGAADVVRVSCFADQMIDYSGMRRFLASAFPSAEVSLVQTLRDPVDSRATCEAVARLPRASETSGTSLGGDPGTSIVNSGPVVFTGLQLSFGNYLDDADSALSRLTRDAEAVHGDVHNPLTLNAFSLDPAAASAIEKTMPKYDMPAHSLTVQTVEGLPSLDAALGIEAVLKGSQPVQSAGTAKGERHCCE